MQIGTSGSAYGPSNVMSRPTVGRAIRAIPAQRLLSGAFGAGTGGRVLPPQRFNPNVIAAELAARLRAARVASSQLPHGVQNIAGEMNSHALPPIVINPTLLAAAPAAPPVPDKAIRGIPGPVPVIHLPMGGLPGPVPGFQPVPHTTVDPSALLARARLAQLFRAQVQ